MKRSILIVILVVVAGVLAYLLLRKKDGDEPSAPKPQPLAVGTHTDRFDESFNKLVTAYYGVKDALVASDSVKVNKAAEELARAADSLRVDEIRDSTNTLKELARNYAGTISGSAKGLKGEKSLEAKRKEFQMISDALYDLMRIVKYNGAKVYYAFCPMAFDQTGAHWLTSSPEIQNPYFGAKMLNCGEIQDSLPKK